MAYVFLLVATLFKEESHGILWNFLLPLDDFANLNVNLMAKVNLVQENCAWDTFNHFFFFLGNYVVRVL